MDVKQAVEFAKSYVSDLFANEQIRDVGLEEVEYDEGKAAWLVTVSFVRPSDQPTMRLAVELAMNGVRRSYKVVRISDKEKKIVSVKDRQLIAA
ncbi:MAG TPA: hypothetical protein VIJ62_03695 [Rhizomicrobium sp.]